MLAEDKVPEPEPLQLVQSGAPRTPFQRKISQEEIEEEEELKETINHEKIEKEELTKNDATNAALSRMYQTKQMNIEIHGDDEALLHPDLKNSPETPKMHQNTILTTSDKEFRSIIFIQNMVRVSLISLTKNRCISK